MLINIKIMFIHLTCKISINKIVNSLGVTPDHYVKVGIGGIFRIIHKT